MWTPIAEQISQATGQPFTVKDQRSVSGGCINQAYCISDGQQRYFIKLNAAAQMPMFEAEALGLKEIYDSKTIRVPRPICWGIAETQAFIVLDWLDFGRGSEQSWQRMGENLAALHRVTSPKGFGWDRNNTIGETPQRNPWTENWAEFYREHRLRYQFQLAHRRSGHFPRQDELLAAVPDLLAGHDPAPSLVHGDLWSGNAAVTTPGEPVILDPATYYGDREVDIAMSELFGSFHPAFYQAYNAAYPLDEGYRQRKTLYNLYHILNHFNLFGGSYASQANRMIDQLLS
jgi:fructosamine-3-kinase